MGNDWWSYLDRLETMAFFSGYPLIYAITMVFFRSKEKNRLSFLPKIGTLLPYAYALVGILYLGLVLKDLYPDYSIKNIWSYFDHSYLKLWCLLSLLFWIPFFARKPIISLLHSILLFFYFSKDLLVFNSSSSGKDMIRNEIKVYSDSLLLNISSLVFVMIVHFFIMTIRNKKPVTDHT